MSHHEPSPRFASDQGRLCEGSALAAFVTRVAAGLLVALSVSACNRATAPVSAVATCAVDLLCVYGTVRFFTLEGGFWAVRGDDSVTYDPLGGLPDAFRQERLRVYLVAKERPDVGGFHMAGPIVEIISIQRLP